MRSFLARSAFPLDGFAMQPLPRQALSKVAIEIEREARKHGGYWPELEAKLHERALELRKQAEIA